MSSLCGEVTRIVTIVKFPVGSVFFSDLFSGRNTGWEGWRD